MKLLAFETATEACSVALWIDGEVRERFELAPRRHAELVLPWAEALLAEAGIARSALDAIAVGRGPGAFTGVRLAIAVAQGIALALARPVVAISTLATLAAGGERGSESLSRRIRSAPGQAGLESDSDPLSPPLSSRILACIDARMGEVYAGAFLRQPDGVAALSPETVSAPDAVLLPDALGGWHGVGTGFAAGGGRLAQRLRPWLTDADTAALPHAADLARLAAAAFARGEALPPERIEPAYLRDQVALTLAQQRAAREPQA